MGRAARWLCSSQQGPLNKPGTSGTMSKTIGHHPQELVQDGESCTELKKSTWVKHGLPAPWSSFDLYSRSFNLPWGWADMGGVRAHRTGEHHCSPCPHGHRGGSSVTSLPLRWLPALPSGQCLVLSHH